MPDSKFHNVSKPKSIEYLAKISGAEIYSADADSKNDDLEFFVYDVAPLDMAGDKDISFLDNRKYRDMFKKTKAGVCIISSAMVEFAPKNCRLLISENPYKSYALIAQYFYPENNPASEISENSSIHTSAKIAEGCTIEAGAVIGEGVEIGVGCWIEPNAVIGNNVKIGKNSRVGANASLSHAIIGEGTRIYSGARIGQDGFGFAIDPAGHVKVPQLGRVLIGDHVEIGANTCIDRGSGPDTVIGNGTWIDNCVQIGHNVKIGQGCVIVALVGIAGSTTLEDYVVVGAQVGIAGHVKIGAGTRIAAQSGIISDLAAGAEVMGSPAQPLKQYLRQVATLKKLTNHKKND